MVTNDKIAGQTMLALTTTEREQEVALQEFEAYKTATTNRITALERENIITKSQVANLLAGSDNSIQKVTQLLLWNVDTNTLIRELTRNSVIDLNVDKGNLNIKAVTATGSTEGNVGSVVFFLVGLNNPLERTEIQNSAPYFAFGDDSGVPRPYKFEVGNYQLQAIPYSETGASGEIGASKYINLSVVKPAVPGQILGCMDPTATNYNPNATAPDPNNACIYPPPTTYVRQASLITAQTNNDSGVLGTPFKLETATSYGVTISSTRSRFPGGKSIRVEGRKADKDASGVIRGEVKINEKARLDRRMIYGYSLFIPYNGEPDGDFIDDPNWRICFQLHAWDRSGVPRQPPVAFNFQNGRMYLEVKWNDQPLSTTYKDSRKIDMGPLLKGRWVDVVVDYYASYGSDGKIDVYFSMINAQGKMELVQKIKDRGPNQYNDDFMAPYPKWGWYAYSWDKQTKLAMYYDEIYCVKGSTANIKDAMPDTSLPIITI